MWFWKSGCRNNPTVPRTQTRTNIQRNSLSTTMATYFQSSMTWKKKPVKDISNLSCYFALPLADAVFVYENKRKQTSRSREQNDFRLGKEFFSCYHSQQWRKNTVNISELSLMYEVQGMAARCSGRTYGVIQLRLFFFNFNLQMLLISLDKEKE